MKKQINLIFPAAFAVALFALPRVNAASANAPASTATNVNSQAAMTALFGDPVVAKGKGFEIKRSELDEVMTGLKSAAAARGQTIPPAQLSQLEGRLLNQLIQVQLLLQKATAADKSNGTWFWLQAPWAICDQSTSTRRGPGCGASVAYAVYQV